MNKVTKNRLPEVLKRLSRAGAVYVPAKKGSQTEFCLWQEGLNPDLESLKTGKSPKEFFFPKSEVLYRWKQKDGQMTIEPTKPSGERLILFGVRGCDLKGIEILDTVFQEEPGDVFYQQRRETAVLITLACNGPAETCFCHIFGIDSAAPKGDISLLTVGDDIYFQAFTKAGQQLLEEVDDLFTVGDETAVLQERQRIREWLAELPYSTLTLTGQKGQKLKDLFAAPIWNQLYEACLGCGTCTFLCPACQCYDIRDFDTGRVIEKQRCWDSCMYSDFTLMAHGNPRTSQKERFRQRFMHKLVYHPENHGGEYACTGCGRCVEKCPSSLNIVKVIKSLEEWENEY